MFDSPNKKNLLPHHISSDFTFQLQEESSGHTKPLDKKGQKIAQFNEYKLAKAFRRPNVTLEDRLNFLKVKEGWE